MYPDREFFIVVEINHRATNTLGQRPLNQHLLNIKKLNDTENQLLRRDFKDGSRRSAAKSERDWYPHWLVPSGFSDTAFASRVSPRALRALRPAGFPHRRSITESERGSYPHRLVPSGFPDTAFASRVSPRALRALRPAGLTHRRSIMESERGSYPHRLVPSGFPDTAFASRVSPRALRALRPAGFPHTRPAATFSKKSQKNAIFFTQKGHPAPQKLKFCMKNIVFFYSKRPPSLAKN